MAEIVIDFFPDGTAKVETFGFEGSACKEASEFLNALGPMLDEELKPEYYGEAPEVVYAGR